MSKDLWCRCFIAVFMRKNAEFPADLTGEVDLALMKNEL